MKEGDKTRGYARDFRLCRTSERMTVLQDWSLSKGRNKLYAVHCTLHMYVASVQDNNVMGMAQYYIGIRETS